MKKNKKKVIIIISLICVLIIAGSLFLFLKNTENRNDVLNVSEKTEAEQVKTEQSEIEQVDKNNIPGFISGGEGNVCGIELPYQIPDTALVIEGIGQYSGEFVEDGSGEPVANVLAFFIRNNSKEFIEYENVTFTLNDSEQASFKISGIPAGKCVLVMEENKREFNRDDSMIYETQLYSERKDISLKEDEIQVYAADGELSVENISKTPFEVVYIRYKTKILPECYLGGITYNCTIEELADGEKKSVKTGHFSDKSSESVMVETVEN